MVEEYIILACILLTGVIFKFGHNWINGGEMKGDRFHAQMGIHREAYHMQVSKERLKEIKDLRVQLADCKKERDDWKKAALK